MKIDSNIKFAQKFEERQKKGPYRTIGNRIVAGMIDASIFLAFNAIIGFALFPLVGHEGYAWVLIVGSVLAPAYSIYLVYRFGGTVGKLLSKVTVLDVESEGRVSFSQSLKREALNILRSAIQVAQVATFMAITESFFYLDYRDWETGSVFLSIVTTALILLAYIELFSALFNSKRRALHDYIGGTVVKKTGALPVRTIVVSVVVFVFAVWLNTRMIAVYG